MREVFVKTLRTIAGVFLIFESIAIFQSGLIAPLTPSIGEPSLADYWEFALVPLCLLLAVLVLADSRILRLLALLVIAAGAIFLASPRF